LIPTIDKLIDCINNHLLEIRKKGGIKTYFCKKLGLKIKMKEGKK